MSYWNSKSVTDEVEEKRVKIRGQVFTPDSIVNDMIDLSDKKIAENCGVDTIDKVSDDYYIDYTVLEPTCGNGNFIIRILDRKLYRVDKLTGTEREIALLRAVASIYGVEISADNVLATKLRMIEVIETGSTKVFELEYKTQRDFLTTGFELSDNLKKSIQYIIDRNIQCGDFLHGKKYLTKKSEYIGNAWEFDKTRLVNAESLLAAVETNKNLMLTQYDFSNEHVAIRERALNNMNKASAEYSQTSEYVRYDNIYKLKEAEVYDNKQEAEEDYDEYDF